MIRTLAAAALALAVFATPALAQTRADTRFNALLAEHEQIERRFDPITSGGEGDDAALARMPDFSPATVEVRRAALADIRTRVAATNERQLSEANQLNRALLLLTIDDDLESLSFDRARLGGFGGGGFDGLGRNTPLRHTAD
nr:DUF885 domain-containing protein [Terricaulis sp.]